MAHDLHPEYLSTKYALEQPGVELIGVQHHHAHLAACLAEHGERGPAIGAIYDGTGYGTDGTVWGGELLHGDLARFERVGSLLPVPMPGGAQAIRQPWRMAAAWLLAAERSRRPAPSAALAGHRPRLGSGLRAGAQRAWPRPQTTSMGRLFDAVAALCGVRTTINYEGQAAIELEARCDPHERGAYPIAVQDGVIDPREAIRAIARRGRRRQRRGRRRALPQRSGPRHGARPAPGAAEAERERPGRPLRRRVRQPATARGVDRRRSTRGGLRVLVPRRLPADDGGISYGQAAVAAARMAA